MAGHSKWANIQHRKAAVDAKRGKLFTKLVKEITVSARLGGGDLTGNPRLRAAVQDARNSNVPNDNIDRAIKKGTGELEGQSYEECILEGYGPGGVAVMVEAVTDNRNRTVSEVRNLFSHSGGNLGESGCVAWMFERRGYFVISADVMDEEAFIELALELEADDITTEDGEHTIFTAPEDFNRIRDELEQRETPLQTQRLAMLPQNSTEITDPDQASQLMRFLDALDDHDDVQHVWSSESFSDEVLARTTE